VGNPAVAQSGDYSAVGLPERGVVDGHVGVEGGEVLHVEYLAVVLDTAIVASVLVPEEVSLLVVAEKGLREFDGLVGAPDRVRVVPVYPVKVLDGLLRRGADSEPKAPVRDPVERRGGHGVNEIEYKY
jgi:hypothetical protein